MKLLFIFSLLLVNLNPLIVHADFFPKPKNEIVIKHPGKLELIYYDQVDRLPPLLPLGKVRANNKIFYVLPNVTTPSVQGIFLLEHTEIKLGESVLDIGSGSGLQAIFAAQKAKHVVATDIDYEAVENTRFNVKTHNLQNKIDTRQGDLFGPIKNTEKFDVIIFNISYPFDEKTQGMWKVHERFFKDANKYLKPNGRIYYQIGWAFNIPKVYSMVLQNGFHIMKMNMVSALEYNREPIVFLIVRNPFKPDIP